jgi:dihydrofolate reductase
MPTQKTPGRKIIAFLMVTLDGYHQAADGDLSWHNVDDEFNEFAAAQMDEADTLLFGRKTYEAWPSSGAARWRWQSMPA